MTIENKGSGIPTVVTFLNDMDYYWSFLITNGRGEKRSPRGMELTSMKNFTLKANPAMSS